MHNCHRSTTLFCLISLCLVAGSAWAENIFVHGTVKDKLGAVVPGVKVELLQRQRVVAATISDGEGNYRLQLPQPGRYRVRVTAASFSVAQSGPVYVSKSEDAHIDFNLVPDVLTQQITVVATGIPIPVAELGFSVDVLNQRDFANALSVQQPLRLIPGVQMTQNGRAGGTTSLFIRGGPADANKVLIDGLPASMVGGFVEFAGISATGVDQVEVLRGPNSALYGSDALAGVVSVTSTRGSTLFPLMTYMVDGGNFGTDHQEGSIGGAYRKLDYFSALSVTNTGNGQQNFSFHDVTASGNFGWTPRAGTSLRVTARRIADRTALPNGIQLFGVPDDAGQTNRDLLLGATLENQTTDSWHNLIRYGRVQLRQLFTDPSPTGAPSDCFNVEATSCYLGAPVTLHGANGFSVSGRAAFQFPGSYPLTALDTTNRDFIYAQSDYRLGRQMAVLFGFKYENERGGSNSSFNHFTARRGNYSYTMQVAGELLGRVHYTLGSGIENNALFGVEATPRVSLAYYLIKPGGRGIFNGTKLRASFGKGIKEPSLAQQFNSLFGLLSEDNHDLITQFGISPVAAQRSRTYDGGIDQLLFGNKGKLSITYFHNQFTNGVEFVPTAGLQSLGVPQEVDDETVPFGGAYVNTLAVRAQGAETELEFKVGPHLFVRGGYTYLDPVVMRSFASDALHPTFNTCCNFSAVPIGAFSPLKGARPFRQAPHSGFFRVNYDRSRWLFSLSGTLVGRRDDSDFLTDQFGGNALLLPNRNLDAAYQRLDFTASCQINRFVQIYSSVGNLLGQHYSESFGYPSLPFTFRSGMKFTFGGESWKAK